jgi:hypothetical protein
VCLPLLRQHPAATHTPLPADVLEITHNLRLSSSPAAAGADLVTGSHHTVWMGDLNYRLDYGAQVSQCRVEARHA